MSKTFVSVIFPLALPQLYSYSVPDHWVSQIEIGLRVEVSLKNKLYSAIIASIDQESNPKYKTKPIVAIIDRVPLVTKAQISMWKWMAGYYCCTLGEVMNVAMPSGLKLESETKVVYNGALDEHAMSLSDDEYLLAEAVSIQNELTILQIQEILNKKTIFPVIRSLLDMRIISVKEELIEKFKPKKVNYLTLNEPYITNPDLLSGVFDMISRSDKQTKLLLAFIQLSRNKQFTFPVSDVVSLSDTDGSVAQALAKKGIFTIHKEIQSRIYKDTDKSEESRQLDALSEVQIGALMSIAEYFELGKPVLLHGITGSGKTRVYAELIKKMVEDAKQTLYLLPEIALTNNMVDRLKTTFGSDVIVYHSRMNNQERVEVWNAVLLGAKIVIAARSGLFLPFVDLGLIIVDEEHDASYKQSDPNPRYNARDAAVYLSHQSGAHIIMGSATPSLESYDNVHREKYGLIEMNVRYGASILPYIQITDLKESYKDKSFKGLFSKDLLEGIRETLDNKEQVLLFQNRRGYAPTINCHICGWKAECNNCDIHMTKHKVFQEMRCHYCGSKSKVPTQCPACGNTDLDDKGFGTEKIEEDIKSLFPHASVARLDFDTARTKLAFESILNEYESRKIDILVGTQMITKGLDFDNIALVGILNADAVLRYPDFRASERAFQLFTQVSGRAGRRAKQGKVIIQTYDPNHPVIADTMSHSYHRFIDRESGERKLFRYPPYFRMIQIELLHKNAATVAHTASVYADNIKKVIGNRLIGPAAPSVARLKGQYIQTITIKMEKDQSIVSRIKRLVMDEKDHLKKISACKSVRVNIDVDPY
ncbi:MAG: primosomal protein N' [Saprospiraceae bacterium]